MNNEKKQALPKYQLSILYRKRIAHFVPIVAVLCAAPEVAEAPSSWLTL